MYTVYYIKENKMDFKQFKTETEMWLFSAEIFGDKTVTKIWLKDIYGNIKNCL